MLNKLHFSLLYLLPANFVPMSEVIWYKISTGKCYQPDLQYASLYIVCILFSIRMSFALDKHLHNMAEPNLTANTSCWLRGNVLRSTIFGYCLHIVNHVQCIDRLKIQATEPTGTTKSQVNNTFLWIPYLHLLPKGPTACTTGRVSVNIILVNILLCRDYCVFLTATSFRRISME